MNRPNNPEIFFGTKEEFNQGITAEKVNEVNRSHYPDLVTAILLHLSPFDVEDIRAGSNGSRIGLTMSSQEENLLKDTIRKKTFTVEHGFKEDKLKLINVLLPKLIMNSKFAFNYAFSVSSVVRAAVANGISVEDIYDKFPHEKVRNKKLFGHDGYKKNVTELRDKISELLGPENAESIVRPIKDKLNIYYNITADENLNYVVNGKLLNYLLIDVQTPFDINELSSKLRALTIDCPEYNIFYKKDSEPKMAFYDPNEVKISFEPDHLGKFLQNLTSNSNAGYEFLPTLVHEYAHFLQDNKHLEPIGRMSHDNFFYSILWGLAYRIGGLSSDFIVYKSLESYAFASTKILGEKLYDPEDESDTYYRDIYLSTVSRMIYKRNVCIITRVGMGLGIATEDILNYMDAYFHIKPNDSSGTSQRKNGALLPKEDEFLESLLTLRSNKLYLIEGQWNMLKVDGDFGMYDMPGFKNRYLELSVEKFEFDLSEPFLVFVKDPSGGESYYIYNDLINGLRALSFFEALYIMVN